MEYNLLFILLFIVLAVGVIYVYEKINEIGSILFMTRRAAEKLQKDIERMRQRILMSETSNADTEDDYNIIKVKSQTERKREAIDNYIKLKNCNSESIAKPATINNVSYIETNSEKKKSSLVKSILYRILVTCVIPCITAILVTYIMRSKLN